MTGEILSVEFFVRTCLWQSIVLVAVGLAASFLLRRRSSRAHQVLLLSIIAAVIVPIVSVLVKHYELGMFVAEPALVQPYLETEAFASEFGPAGPVDPGFEYEMGMIEGDLGPTASGSQGVPLPWARIALCGWVVAGLILVVRLLVTFGLGVRLLGRAAPVDCAEMHEAVHIAGAKLGIEKDVEIRSSRGVRSPVIWCWRRRPVLLVPGTIGRYDNGVDWAGVLCHELAHWKRRDHISGLLAELAVCALPWHPLLWWAKYRLTSLSEQACDDWVLATGQVGTDYAESLLDLRPGGQMAFVPAVVSSKKGLADRIRRILKDSCGNPRTGAAWALAVSVITICVALGVAFAQTRPAKPDVELAAIEPNESADPNEPMVSVNFKNAEFKTIIRKLADWTGKTIIPSDEVLKQKVTMYAPQRLRRNEAVAVMRNALRAKGYVVEETAKIIYIRRVDRALPAGWSLDYDDGRRAGGARTWAGSMAADLARLRIRTYDPSKGEKYEFDILSMANERIGHIRIEPESDRGLRLPDHQIVKPGKYLVKYRRRYGTSGDNFRIEHGAYPVDLSKPGMYELRFTPKVGTAEISGTLGGCYAINFERVGSAPRTRGYAYQNAGKQYLLDGLPPGRYRLSAVTQRQSDNVFVDRAEVTVAAGEKVTVDMARPAKGSCSLKGSILGRQRTYTFDTPDSYQSEGRWFVLIRSLGSGTIKTADAYEAQTMDSLYAVRGRNIIQDTEDKASYTIEGIAAGEYTVTAMEHPWYSGSAITRQQSKRLTIRPAENVLDFDLRITPDRNHNPDDKANKEDSGEASARSDESAAEGVNKEALVQRSYRLKNYSPAKMSRIVEPLLSDFGHQSSDEETSTLLIIDTVERLTRIEKIIERLDVPDAERFVTKIFQIYHGDPSDIVRTLVHLLRDPWDRRPSTHAPGLAASVTGPSGQPVVLIPEQTRKWIIVKASAADMKRIAEWIEKLDKTEKVEREYETVVLKYANAGEMADRLNEVIRQMQDTELQQGVLIQPLTQAKHIMIFGRKDQREKVKKLIAAIDGPSGALETRAFELKYADPDRIKKNIEAIYEHRADKVRMIAYPTMHQVTVIASPENMLKIADLIAEWDVPLDLEQIKPRIFTLRNSDPSRMAGLLTTLFAGEDGGGVNMYEVLFSKDTEERRKTFGPVSRQLTFEAVPGTKKIIVISTFGEAYDVVGKLILELDKQKMAAKDVEQVREWIARLVSEGRLRGSNISGVRVTGLVKDPQGRPVSGTRVTLFQTKLEYVTAGEGQFTAFLPSSNKMRYFFAVDKLRELVGVGRLAGGKQQVEINLVRARIVSGRVLDPTGRPVSGAQIAPLPMTCFHVLTDSEGRFDVGWSSEWAGNIKDFCLMARHVELNLAALVDVVPETQTVDVKLEPGLALRGTVEDANDRPILGAVVGLSLIRGWGAGTPVGDVVTDEQGRFELAALPQRQEYGVRANAEGYQRNMIKTGMINRMTEWEQVGPIILKKPILSVSGIVVDGSGKPVGGIGVYWRGEGQPRLTSETDTQGRFRFDKVCAGPVRINAKNETLFGTIETQGGVKDIRLVVGPRFAPQPDDPPR